MRTPVDLQQLQARLDALRAEHAEACDDLSEQEARLNEAAPDERSGLLPELIRLQRAERQARNRLYEARNDLRIALGEQPLPKGA